MAPLGRSYANIKVLLMGGSRGEFCKTFSDGDFSIKVPLKQGANIKNTVMGRF